MHSGRTGDGRLFSKHMTVRTRFAPSPTGYLHIGGARTALFNWLYARKHGGVFVLRIEDTDAARNTEAARKAIFDGMEWLGLDWDEGPMKGGNFGPYQQSERGQIYDAWFEKLVQTDRVYQLDGAWRFRFERKPITMIDGVCGEVTIDYRDESNTPDMVIKRSDGSYVFHFVNVVDDLEMEITHVIRGEDHLMNTPKHLQLIEALGCVAPQYCHIPLILNGDGSKMSKRDEGAALGDYPRHGFVAAAVANFIALLGWNPKNENEIFTLDELAENFSLAGINRAPARFDFDKCRWFNQQHMAKLSLADFHHAALPFIAAASLPTEEFSEAMASAVKEKVRLLEEVPHAVEFLLDDGFSIDHEAMEKLAASAIARDGLIAIAERFASVDEWTLETAKISISDAATMVACKPGQLMFPLRVSLSGRSHGPDLNDLLMLLGKSRCVQRVQRMIENLA